MELPAELRLEIYRYVCAGQQLTTGRDMKFYKHHLQQDPILRVNRQTRQQCLPVWYGENEFWFLDSGREILLAKAWLCATTAYHEHLRSVLLFVREDPGSWKWSKFMEKICITIKIRDNGRSIALATEGTIESERRESIAKIIEAFVTSSESAPIRGGLIVLLMRHLYDYGLPLESTHWGTNHVLDFIRDKAGEVVVKETLKGL